MGVCYPMTVLKALRETLTLWETDGQDSWQEGMRMPAAAEAGAALGFPRFAGGIS
jgi:hypothetical protein